jgi:dimeric dUTPase (all-alpha-NTP-PPase superfamily)
MHFSHEIQIGLDWFDLVNANTDDTHSSIHKRYINIGALLQFLDNELKELEA